MYSLALALQMKQPKLDIKKDIKGVVTVPGATVVEVTSAKELMNTLEAGQKRRHVSSTQVRNISAPLGPLTSICFICTLSASPTTTGASAVVQAACAGVAVCVCALRPSDTLLGLPAADEPRVLPVSPHHDHLYRGHQPADTECVTRQAVLCGPGWL